MTATSLALRPKTWSANTIRSNAFSPHYAGVPSQVIAQAIASMGLEYSFPLRPTNDALHCVRRHWMPHSGVIDRFSGSDERA